MAKYKIAWMPGDGIGRDVLDATKIVLDALSFDAEYIPAEIGWDCWEKYKNPLPDKTIEILKESKCAMFGAITSKPNVPGYRSPIVKMRQLFDLYQNLRPIKAYEGNPTNYREGIDMVIFRENTEDLYSGIEFPAPLPEEFRKLIKDKKIPEDAGISCRMISKTGSERIARAAFEYAKKKGRKKVTVVHKANVIRVTDGIFLEAVRNVAKNYPDIKLDDANVDAVTMWLIKNPLDFDVVVTTNMFGDIISDEAAQLVGGMGFASSGNIGDKFAVFEPTHGSAPKYAGMYKVNPIAAILAAKLMFDWLGETATANAIEQAVVEVVKEAKVRTYDMKGTNTTLEVGKAIAEKVAKKLSKMP